MPAASASLRTSKIARVIAFSWMGSTYSTTSPIAGAVSADPLAGDGAGILIQLPDRLFRAEAKRLKLKLPKLGHYGVGMVFLPRNVETRRICESVIAGFIAAEGQSLLGWRDVPVDPSALGREHPAQRPGDPAILRGARRQLRRCRCLRAQAFRHPQAVAPGDPRAQAARWRGVLHRQPVDPHRHLQGHGDPRAAGALLQGPGGRAGGIGARDGPCPVLDQHLPDLGVGASVPLSRA